MASAAHRPRGLIGSHSLEAHLREWVEEAKGETTGFQDAQPVLRRSSSAGLPLRPWYGDPAPGGYPFTRFRSARGYAEELWVMGQYSGYGTPRETNSRFRRLLEAGQTGLSIALDLPTQMGLDSDNARSAGEVGRVGVPLDTVDDLLDLLRGLPLERVKQMRTTANSIGPIFAAFALVALDELKVDVGSLRLMLQNDPLKEYCARGTYIFPPEAALRFAVDVVEYLAQAVPHWEPIEFCGYHLRDAGATASEEIGLATANGIAYLREVERRGLTVEEVLHALYVFLSAGVDIFEEAAKFRATRRLWARLLSNVFEVPEAAASINIFAYTLGGALTAQEPLNNVVRVAYETLAAVLGGAQTIATSSFDEALGLPTPEAAHLALRTQQIAAYESGATHVIDPLGGSHYVEALTDGLEREAIETLLRVEQNGGAVRSIESGLFAEIINESASRFQSELEMGERPVVGVSIFRTEAEPMRTSFRVPPELEATQCAELRKRRAARDQPAVDARLRDVTDAVRGGANCIPSVIEAVRARATIEEISRALGEVVGFHTSTSTHF